MACKSLWQNVQIQGERIFPCVECQNACYTIILYVLSFDLCFCFSAYIAQFPEYTVPLINHLLKRKVQHWDTSIRELTAQTLYNLTSTAPKLMVEVALPELIPLTKDIDLCARHGGILAVAQITHALANYAKSNNQKIQGIVGAELIREIQNIPAILMEKKLFRGIGGELMRHAVCVLIEKSSLAALPFHECWDIIDLWQDILEQCLRYVEPDIRAYAVSVLSMLSWTLIWSLPPLCRYNSFHSSGKSFLLEFGKWLQDSPPIQPQEHWKRPDGRKQGPARGTGWSPPREAGPENQQAVEGTGVCRNVG
ncbi:tubulin-specific chaperone D-like [Tachypleus tridentatus]|uniref:tubulin-specific chaperone D-like n=1 Tax=Tachypleus tridentatus TaxID=6853 RepID=UPI003FD1D49F